MDTPIPPRYLRLALLGNLGINLLIIMTFIMLSVHIIMLKLALIALVSVFCGMMIRLILAIDGPVIEEKIQENMS